MSISNRKETVLLFLGDIFFFLLALYATLIIRYGRFPSQDILLLHLTPFALLFLVWVLVFYIVGLYDKHTGILKGRLPTIILNAQIANSLLAVAFFYFIPYFGITPRTNLFLYLFISFGLILIWRSRGIEFLGIRRRQKALLIGSGEEMKELKDEVNSNNRYNLTFVSSVDLQEIDDLDIQEDIINKIYSEGITTVVVDLKNEKVERLLPHLYNLIFSRVHFIDIYRVYEDIFDRVPLSLLQYSWFLENISHEKASVLYDYLKRAMDVVLASLLSIPTLVIFPIVALAIKIEDGGPIFITQDRVGQNNKPVRIYKFRSMTGNDHGNYMGGQTTLQETRVGSFLRKARIDELPQLWSVFRGDLSLIGPRLELPALVKQYLVDVPYYNIRHLIKPGLSGWAQIYHEHHPHHGTAVRETKVKLSYDLYYIKNRSLMLDVKIALRTLNVLLSRSGA